MIAHRNPEEVFAQLVAADEAGVRLELVGGRPTWEFHPAPRHQVEIQRVLNSLKKAQGADPECGCLGLPEVYVRFADGSFKRPDISIFCRMPDELEEAVSLIPEAVVEVVSRGFEAKDLEVGPPFYLSQGVKDVVVFDPRTLLVLHARRHGTRRLTSPVEIRLECGCVLTA
jgi:hypothetical protein